MIVWEIWEINDYSWDPHDFVPTGKIYLTEESANSYCSVDPEKRISVKTEVIDD